MSLWHGLEEARAAPCSRPHPGAGSRRELRPARRRLSAPPLCSVIAEKFVFNAHIIETGTDFYRLATARECCVEHGEQVV